MEKSFDIGIIGAGAAGLAAAVTAKAASPELTVALIEKKKEPAQKLRASGNGRGNITNSRCRELSQVLRFFSESGIATRIDGEGRIYPYSEEAKAVADALVKRAVRLGVCLMTESDAQSVEAEEEGFRIFICRDRENGEKKSFDIRTRRLLIAAGGKSFAVYGSTGDGYKMARSLGHGVAPLVPALTAIEVRENIADLKGVRVKGEASLFAGGDLLFKEAGEIQFREDAVSGICIMNMSSCLPAVMPAAARTEDAAEAPAALRPQPRTDARLQSQTADRPAELKLRINLVPDFDAAGLIEFLQSGRSLPAQTALDLLCTLVKKPLALRTLKEAGIEPERPAAKLAAGELVNVANALRGMTLSPCGRKGWKEAQVTRGGVRLEELSEDMQSKLVRGLYFAGEVTDYDGPCGGYNLHNAWLTGIKAGRSMALSASEEKRP